MFTSPVMYDKEKSVKAVVSSKQQFIHAICLKCLLSEDDHAVTCRHCRKRLNSESIQIGTLYKFDLFAAFACCQPRLACNKCNSPVMDHGDEAPASFSSFSEERECPSCRTRDYHFIKPLGDIFLPSKCSSIAPALTRPRASHLESILDV